MPTDQFRHVRTWVFDLDNTLYPPRMRLFDQIEVRMTAYVMRTLGVGRAEADRLRAHYWSSYGTTLAGLMREHAIDPDPYLAEVHEIDFSALAPDPALAAALAALPGRRIVYTNGSAPYAHRVIAARGLSGLFHAVYGIEHAGYRPKPERAAFETVFARDGVDPARAAMFEDDSRNLVAPHEMGMRTVLVAPAAETGAHIHHHTAGLADFLAALAADCAEAPHPRPLGRGRHGGYQRAGEQETSMTALAPAPRRAWFHHAPVLGWIAHDLAHGPEDTIYYALVIALTVLVLAFKAWGIVAIAMTALAMVPVVFVTLILITIGR
ncbi:MAG: pyrimidine 5'-nucleotidase [Proteobacteria bacterium]|nr:pyrimidine 5'-nucleotidase [Pseudomonadota bacterium]MBS0574519.1 pyrimidine 5'-nucleotidase [Pseudomonadota bacterium]